jgi:hypothetical protein
MHRFKQLLQEQSWLNQGNEPILMLATTFSALFRYTHSLSTAESVTTYSALVQPFPWAQIHLQYSWCCCFIPVLTPASCKVIHKTNENRGASSYSSLYNIDKALTSHRLAY